MAYKVTNAVNEGKKVEWIPRQNDNKLLSAQVSAEFHQRVMDYCAEHDISYSSWMRYVLNREMRGA